MACSRKLHMIEPSPYPIYIVFVLYFMGLGSYTVALESLVFNKVCLHSFSNASHVCSNSSFTSDHKGLQDEAAAWSNYMMLVFLLPVLMATLLLSSYCDRVGYKLPFMLPLAGAVLSMVVASLLSTQQWPLPTLFVYSFISGLFGNYPMIVMAGLSYLSAIHPIEKRTLSFAMGEGCAAIGSVLGALLTGFASNSISVDKLFFINIGLALLAFVIALMFMREMPRTNANAAATTWHEIFGFKRIADAFVCLFRRRSSSRRLLIFMALGVYFFAFSSFLIMTSVTFLYIVKELGHSVSTFYFWNAVQNSCRAMFAPLFLIVMKRVGHADEYLIAVLSCGVTSLGFVVMSLGPNDWMLWVGDVMICLQLNVFAMSRKFITQLIDDNEIGKLFACLSIVQLAVTIGGSVVAKVIYPLTLSFWPAFPFALSSFLSTVALTMLVILAFTNVHEENHI